MPDNATIKDVPLPLFQNGNESFMNIRKFWPLDFDPEDEVYETLVWDLPGYRKKAHARVNLTSPGTAEPPRNKAGRLRSH
jgi:hypothetical protein